jgi:hypothetical protein
MLIRGLAAVLCLAFFAAIAQIAEKNTDSGEGQGYSDTPTIPGQKWRVHDRDRPRPPVVTPGAQYGQPPSDAIVLFDGRDTSKWVQMRRGRPVPFSWKVENGYMECVARVGDIATKDKFGDAQFHIEWAAPAGLEAAGQDRGNSGVLLMGRYEVQVLDSWNNATYADGQAGAIYGWWPPLVNAVRKPGEWQTYDIFFEAPRFKNGALARPAYVTVMLNGVLVQHHQEIGGPMAHRIVRKYEAHAPEEPLALQNHNTKVRFRNIWARKLNLPNL